MKKEDSLKKRYGIKLLATVVSGLINAVLIAIVPKALGPVFYGQFVYLQDFFMKALGFLDMGSSIAFFTKLSAKQTRKELISFYFLYSLLILSILLAFIYSMQSFGYTNILLPNISKEYIFMGLFFGFFTWFTQVFIKISDAYALTFSVEIMKIGHKVISLLLLLYFVNFTVFDLEKYFYFHYIALISFLLIISWLFLKRGIFLDIFNTNFSIRELLKEFLEYCHPLFVYSVVGLLAGIFDIWLLQKIAGSEQTGFYGLAYSLAAMCFVFSGAMTPIITREFSKSFENKDLQKMKTLFYRYIPMLYSFAAFFALFLSAQSDNILAIFTDENYTKAVVVVMIMALYPVHQTYGQLSGSIFYATGQTKLMRNISLFTQPFGMLLSLLLIYLFDLEATGLALKMIILQIIAVNIQLYFNAKFLNLNMKSFLLHQVYSLSIFALLAYSITLFVSLGTPLLSFLFSGILYTILVTIITYMFPQIFALKKDEILQFKEMILIKIGK